MQIYI